MRIMNSPVYYVCKYTPLELLSGFGLTAERLDPAPASFECADSCGHPNLCGYGKAVLEEVIGQGIKAVILVDCCDVCRRIYDILKSCGDMEFLFLLSLPHKNGHTESKLLERELQRLCGTLERYTRQRFCLSAALKAWEDTCSSEELAEIAEPHLCLTGAHGGRRLLGMIRSRFSLPVADDTCTGNRRLCRKEPATGSDEFFPDYAAALLGQESPCMRMQFRKEKDHPGALGIICHTVKFCDYYGFQYRGLRGISDVPLLKIETDCTPQSGGQLKTRLDAFCETIQPRGIAMNNTHKTIRYAAGVDSGSASTDAVIMDEARNILGTAILPTGAGAAAGADRALSAALTMAGLRREDLDAVVTTGYGRETVGVSDSSVTEITCHARGAHFLYPEARTVIDIGGQDSKVIRIDGNGNIENFVMNDKCAAGTGRFLEMMARTLELTLPEMSELGLAWKNDVAISSMCTVFAESEVVSLVADNTAPEDIIHGLNMSVAAKTAALVKRAGGEPAFVMTGGVAQNRGVVKALEEKLGIAVHVPKEAQLCGALGAALIAMDGQ